MDSERWGVSGLLILGIRSYIEWTKLHTQPFNEKKPTIYFIVLLHALNPLMEKIPTNIFYFIKLPINGYFSTIKWTLFFCVNMQPRFMNIYTNSWLGYYNVHNDFIFNLKIILICITFLYFKCLLPIVVDIPKHSFIMQFI